MVEISNLEIVRRPYLKALAIPRNVRRREAFELNLQSSRLALNDFHWRKRFGELRRLSNGMLWLRRCLRSLLYRFDLLWYGCFWFHRRFRLLHLLELGLGELRRLLDRLLSLLHGPLDLYGRRRVRSHFWLG